MPIAAELDATVNYQFLASQPESISKIVLEGSSRSSKTYSIIQFLILNKLLMYPNYKVTCWRLNSRTHNKTTIEDFKEVMASIGEASGIEQYWEHAGRWRSIDKEYIFKNGSVLAFDGTSDAQKIQGRKQNISWYNEVMEIPKQAFDQASMRTTDLQIFDYNPSFNQHWLFSTILTQIESGEVSYKHSTFRDNPFLSDAQVREIEKYNPDEEVNVINGTADQWHWDVYGLGKRGRIKGAIFSYWEIYDGEWPEPEYCQRFGYGMDFGFSLDPSTLIECSLHQDMLYVREIIYEHELLITRNMTNPSKPSIESRMVEQSIAKDIKIYADCASPSSIEDLRTAGFNMVPSIKGPDSIMQGIELLKKRKIRVHRNSVNIQAELEHYRWKQDKDEVFKLQPIDDWNHAIDAMRYWARSELQRADKETVQAMNPTYRRPRKATTPLSRRKRR